jgi:hypothetical protein
MRKKLRSENLKKTSLETQTYTAETILNRILEKQYVRMWTGFKCLRIGSSGGKGKVVPVPFFLTPRPLYHQGKRPRYPVDRRLGGPQNRSERGGGEKNSQPPPGIEP